MMKQVEAPKLEVVLVRNSSRLISLDTLRGIALILVLVRHMNPLSPPEYGKFVGGIMGFWHEAGWVGVDLFFVLSGFLVSGLLFSEYARYGTISIKRFLIRRGLKIYPGFYLLLVIYGAFEWKVGRTFSWGGVLSEAFYIQNYVPGIWNHTWSLAVEEHFYLVIVCLLAILATRKRMHLVPSVAVGTFIFCFIARLITVNRGGDAGAPTHLRMDALMFGVLMSYFYHFKREQLQERCLRSKYLIFLGSVLLTIPSLLASDASNIVLTVGLSCNYLAFGGLLLMAVFHEHCFEKWRWGTGLALIGSYSYTIYLWHMFAKRVLSYFRKVGWEMPVVIEWGLYIVLSIAIGVVAARLIERPVLRLRDKFFPSRSEWQKADDQLPRSETEKNTFYSQEMKAEVMQTVNQEV